MKKFMKYTGIILPVLIALILIFAFLGKSEVLKLNIEKVDLAQIPDGTYTGSYNNYRWSNEVEVHVSGHKIIQIKPIKIQSGRDSLVEELTAMIISHQSTDVDAISGATASSNGFLKAVETALKSSAVKQ